MTTTEIKQSLCIYDKCNPDYDEDNEKLIEEKDCYCDNCFRGKHQLANELLRVKEALVHTRNEIRSLTRVSDEEANTLLKYIESYLVD